VSAKAVILCSWYFLDSLSRAVAGSAGMTQTYAANLS